MAGRIVRARAVVKKTEAAVPKSCTEEVLVSEKAGSPVKNLRNQKYSNAKVLRLVSDPLETCKVMLLFSITISTS